MLRAAATERATPIRVLIADDDGVVRALLEEVVRQEPTMTLVGAAEDAAGAIELAARENPDVAVLDWVMPGGGGPEAARGILNQNPDVRIVALTAHDSPEASVDMLRAGATCVVVKGTPGVVDAIRSAAAGG